MSADIETVLRDAAPAQVRPLDLPAAQRSGRRRRKVKRAAAAGGLSTVLLVVAMTAIPMLGHSLFDGADDEEWTGHEDGHGPPAVSDLLDSGPAPVETVLDPAMAAALSARLHAVSEATGHEWDGDFVARAGHGDPRRQFVTARLLRDLPAVFVDVWPDLDDEAAAGFAASHLESVHDLVRTPTLDTVELGRVGVPAELLSWSRDARQTVVLYVRHEGLLYRLSSDGPDVATDSLVSLATGLTDAERADTRSAAGGGQ